MSLPPPDARFQLQFLRELQRILEEGRFTASYKFALVLSLADLAVQRGSDTGDPLRLPVAAIAERFTEHSWRQVAPWPGGEHPEVLNQNTGRRAVVVRAVLEARQEYGERIDRLRTRPEEWSTSTDGSSGTRSSDTSWRGSACQLESRTTMEPPARSRPGPTGR